MYLASISALEHLEERLVAASAAPCFISFSTASAGLAQPQLATDDDVQVGSDTMLLSWCLGHCRSSAPSSTIIVWKPVDLDLDAWGYAPR
jgi:hypothetical protein